MKVLKYIIENKSKIYIFPFWFFLFLLSLIYGFIVVYKRKKGYKEKIEKVKIISVGNITLGGTGKTEFVLYLAKNIKNSAIILRGYKGKGNKKFMEVKENTSFLLAGDEAILLKKRSRKVVFVSRKRKYGIEAALKKYRNIKYIILDDAFQHFEIKRDINIILIDYTNPFGNKFLIPAGFLREPISSLKYADIILITKYDENYKSIYSRKELEEIIKKYNPSIKIFYSSYIPDFNYNKFKNKRIIIFSAIANYEYFLFLVKKYLSPSYLLTYFFPDHYFYSENDINRLVDIKNKENIDYIFTTEKDIVKISLRYKKLIKVFKIKFKVNDNILKLLS